MGDTNEPDKAPSGPANDGPDAALAAYRLHLVAAEQKAQEDFDKTILSLSGGALGVSFVFLKDIVGPEHVAAPAWLFAAWLTWASARPPYSRRTSSATSRSDAQSSKWTTARSTLKSPVVPSPRGLPA